MSEKSAIVVRWENSIPHHRTSVQLMEELCAVDLENDLAMDLRVGGDGDNGELLMYLMDIVFERRDVIVDEVIEKGHRCSHGTILCPKCYPR